MYIDLAAKSSVESREISKGIILDYDDLTEVMLCS